MFEFASPWMFLLLVLPLLVARFAPVYRAKSDSLRVPFFRYLVEISGETPRAGAVKLERARWQRALLPLSWLLIVSSLARPEWIAPPIVHEESARDIMVAVDLSGSMAARDFTGPADQSIDRLEAVKLVLTEFVGSRTHDRLGLIVFGDAPYLQVPFTQDHDTWLALLLETEVAMAGQSTAFGDAIGLAIKVFEASTSENRVLVVLTDGNDTGSRVPPVDAAKVAAARGLKIYTVAIGDPATAGEEALELEVLEKVAQLTQGNAYVALNRAELTRASIAISAQEPQMYDAISYRPRHSLHYFPLAILITMYTGLFAVVMLHNRFRRESVRV